MLVCSHVRQENSQKVFNKKTVEKSEDERLMDKYRREYEIHTNIIKQNISFYELAEWLDESSNEDEDGYQKAEEIVSAIIRQIVSTKPYEVILGMSMMMWTTTTMCWGIICLQWTPPEQWLTLVNTAHMSVQSRLKRSLSTLFLMIMKSMKAMMSHKFGF